MAPPADVPAGGTVILASSHDEDKQPPELRFIHYNDVYHIDASSSEPVGGIARFQTLCDYYRDDEAFAGQPELITLFSGDAFNPSLESSITKGSHMVPVLNHIGTDAACLGNHDLDFGVPTFTNLASKCHFPWLVANVLDPALGPDTPLARCQKTAMLTASNGLQIGLIGLVEREWLDTINSLPPDIEYRSASATANELAPKLREQGADMVIALTHQREPNDEKLARLTGGALDLVLGGHDHYYGLKVVEGTHVMRSGTDFKQLSYIRAWRRQPASDETNPKQAKWDFAIMRRDVIRSIEEHPGAQELVSQITSRLASKLEKPLGYTSAPLDARFTTVRRRESNIGNFVCDLMRLYFQADCAIMAAGTIRGDCVYPVGVLKAKDIMDCFPFEDPTVVVRISGAALRAALENGVSTYPALEGRFPQVSNLAFTFDPSLPPHARITKLHVGNPLAPVDPEKQYTVSTREYMIRGKDGFSSLLSTSHGGEAEEVVPDEHGVLISTLLRQYFMSLRVVARWQRQIKLHHAHTATASRKRDPQPAKTPTHLAVPDASPGRRASVEAHFASRIHDHLHAAHPATPADPDHAVSSGESSALPAGGPAAPSTAAASEADTPSTVPPTPPAPKPASTSPSPSTTRAPAPTKPHHRAALASLDALASDSDDSDTEADADTGPAAPQRPASTHSRVNPPTLSFPPSAPAGSRSRSPSPSPAFGLLSPMSSPLPPTLLSPSLSAAERRDRLVRWAAGRWRRAVGKGLSSGSAAGGSGAGVERQGPWKGLGVAPRVEGRIICVGGDGAK